MFQIPRIDVKDELVLRQVFFGEGSSPKNYVILCHSEPEDDKSASLPISSVFADAQAEVGVGPTPLGEFGLIDCNHVLPSSGKTIAQRFGIDLNKRPTIFISGPAIEESKPKQIPAKHLKTGHMFAKLLKQMLEPHAAKISNAKDLKSKCLNKDYCGLLLKGGPPETFVKDAVKNLLTAYPQVQFASVDSKSLYLSNLEAEYMPEFQSGVHRFVLFRKVSGGMSVGGDEDTKKEGRIITSILPLPESESISFGSIKKIIDKGLIQKEAAMKKIPSLPQVKTRTKKLEEAERKKRQRTQQQRQKKKESQNTNTAGGGGGQFSANDGSKDGRRAERERRRQEHRKNNPNYKEKTPEELAEMERKRRQRMAEEAEKWNVAPEDAPPEGTFFEEDDGDSFSDETYVEYEDIDELADTEDEDEDILDLD